MASEYLKWKYRDVTPDQPVVLTKKQKAANWWYYHRWWLLLAALLLGAALSIARGILGGGTAPDCQLACVTDRALSGEELKALADAFSALGTGADGDGKTVVSVNSYASPAIPGDSDAAGYAAAARVRLMADLESAESYFFICDDAETFHRNHEILARADGSLAGDPREVLCFRLGDCPALADLVREHPALSDLFLARRGFWGDRVCRNKETCDRLWSVLAADDQGGPS